ncbi:hypothetical protein BDW22DRAFT_1168421 [Trametopsis cervina]|nr:hypothetical protein BDW22DRAFT_1168421 [Trametopsis cervina]
MDSTSPLSPELHAAVLNSFAPVHIGSTVSVGLLGITILQAWLYYYNYPDDNLYTKLLVAVVCVVEFIRSSFTVHAAYYYLVLNWGNPDALNAIVWSLSLLLLMTKIVELMVHLYFAWRIWTLSRLLVVRWTLTAVVVTLTLWNCAMGIATYVISIESAGISAYATGAQKILSPFGLAVAILTDFTIMVSLIFLLNRGRSGLSRTNRIINTLIFYAIQAGMITVLADIVVIVLNHYIDRIGFEYLGVYSVVGNLYANSLLARSVLRIADYVVCHLRSYSRLRQSECQRKPTCQRRQHYYCHNKQNLASRLCTQEH